MRSHRFDKLLIKFFVIQLPLHSIADWCACYTHQCVCNLLNLLAQRSNIHNIWQFSIEARNCCSDTYLNRFSKCTHNYCMHRTQYAQVYAGRGINKFHWKCFKCEHLCLYSTELAQFELSIDWKFWKILIFVVFIYLPFSITIRSEIID